MATVTENTIGLDAAKAQWPELLERAVGGQEITITKNGTPVARIVPARKQSTVEERRAAIQAMLESAKGRSLGGLQVRDLINEGRR